MFLDAPVRLLRRINEGFAFVAKYITLSLMAAMTAIILLQVFYRYVLNQPLSWTEEVSRFMMVWMTFLIAPIAYREGSNVSIDMIAALLKGRAHYLLQLLLNILVMVIVVTFMWVLLKERGIVASGWGRTASSVNITMFWVYLAMPVGIGIMVLVSLELILDDIRHIIDPHKPDTPQDHPDPSRQQE